MPRPTNKADLLSESTQEYEALEALLAPLTAEQMTQPCTLGDWSVKDVLAHLLEWQQMFFGWYDSGLRGEIPSLPAPGYNWGQLPALNQKIYETYCNHPLAEILSAFRESHQKTMALVESLSETHLFTPSLYPWLGTHTLGTFITANTGSHYRWARTAMRKKLKPRKLKAA